MCEVTDQGGCHCRERTGPQRGGRNAEAEPASPSPGMKLLAGEASESPRGQPCPSCLWTGREAPGLEAGKGGWGRVSSLWSEGAVFLDRPWGPPAK